MTNQITPGRARQIMRLYKPRGWVVKMGGVAQRGASGLCSYATKTIRVPLVCDDYSLAVYLHEVAHVKLHEHARTPSHVQEYEAEQWAFDALRKVGFRVTRTLLSSAKDNVRTHLIMNLVEGLPIDRAIRRWVGHLRS